MKFPGNWIGNRTPWTFRLDAHTGQVIDGEEFGGMGVAPVRLFDDLMRLHGETRRAIGRHVILPGNGF
jgi:hypothetical protein